MLSIPRIYLSYLGLVYSHAPLGRATTNGPTTPLKPTIYTAGPHATSYFPRLALPAVLY